eukprot:29112-Pelagococcus_subviridis.AAC.3
MGVSRDLFSASGAKGVFCLLQSVVENVSVSTRASSPSWSPRPIAPRAAARRERRPRRRSRARRAARALSPRQDVLSTLEALAPPAIERPPPADPAPDVKIPPAVAPVVALATAAPRRVAARKHASRRSAARAWATRADGSVKKTRRVFE